MTGTDWKLLGVLVRNSISHPQYNMTWGWTTCSPVFLFSHILLLCWCYPAPKMPSSPLPQGMTGKPWLWLNMPSCQPKSADFGYNCCLIRVVPMSHKGRGDRQANPFKKRSSQEFVRRKVPGLPESWTTMGSSIHEIEYV